MYNSPLEQFEILPFLTMITLLGFSLNSWYYRSKKAPMYSIFCYCFIGFYGWLLFFAPIGFLNLGCVDSGILLLVILIGLELFAGFYPRESTLLGFCGVLACFEAARFEGVGDLVEFFLDDYFWLVICLFPLFLMAYAWGFFKVLKKTLKSLKGKGFVWNFFGLRLKKIHLFMKYYIASRKSRPYNFFFFVDDLVIFPMALVSAIRVFALPFLGTFFTLCVVGDHNTAPFWYFFLYVCLLTCIVNNPSFQFHVKKHYHFLFFKAGLWNVIPAVCLACGQVGATAFGIGALDFVGTRCLNEYAYRTDVISWRTDIKAWSEDCVLISREAAGPMPMRPLRTDLQYNQRSFTERGASTVVEALKKSLLEKWSKPKA